MGRLYSNNYSTTITTVSLGTGDTSVTVSSAVGLPLIGGGDYCLLTLTDSLTAPTKTEIIKATALAGNVLTIERAQESTTAQTWASGDIIELRATADSFARLDGTEITRYVETYNASATTTIDRADGGIQTFTMVQNETFTFVINDSETMMLQILNTNTYVPSFTGVNWPSGISPVLTGPSSIVTIFKVNGTVYGAVVGDY